MNEEERKDFFNIAKMTQEFRKVSAGRLEAFQDPSACRVWELRFQLAIAQQLSVISARLGEIVEKSKQ